MFKTQFHNGEPDEIREQRAEEWLKKEYPALVQNWHLLKNKYGAMAEVLEHYRKVATKGVEGLQFKVLKHKSMEGMYGVYLPIYNDIELGQCGTPELLGKETTIEDLKNFYKNNVGREQLVHYDLIDVYVSESPTHLPVNKEGEVNK